MDKEWQKKKEEWYNSEITRRKNEVIDVINSCEFIDDDKKKELISKFDKWLKFESYLFDSDMIFLCFDYDCSPEEIVEWSRKINDLDLRGLRSMIEHKSYYKIK